MSDEQRRYLLICNTADGLVSQINGVVVQLQLARRLGLEPIVYLPARSYLFGGPNPYYEESTGPNVWEYYFEPIGPSPDALRDLAEAGRVLTLTNASEFSRLLRWEPASWIMNPYGYSRSVENHADGAYPAAWWLEQREKARVFLDDGTIRFKRTLTSQVDEFVKDNFTPHTLGLQLRGSDKFDFGVGPNLSRKIVPEEYFAYIDRYLAAAPEDTRIFVATDQRQWLKIMERAYPGKILSFSEWSLSDSDVNLFHSPDQKARRGAEVLIDAMLLSRCGHLIKCHAGVGEMALVLNRELEFVDLNYVEQTHRARRTAAYSLFSPVISAICSAWRSLGESRPWFAKVSSVVEGNIFVDGDRPLWTKIEAKEKAPAPHVISKRFISATIASILRFLADRCFRYNPISGGKISDAVNRLDQEQGLHGALGGERAQLAP